jgi:predicted HTH transcriptional regulator
MFTHMHRLYRSRKRNYMPMNRLDTELRFKAQRWTKKRLQRLVDLRARERSDLEFKQEAGDGRSLKNPLAAMANSGGGSILYGVKETDTAATRLTPIPLAGIEEKLRQVNEGIDPPVAFEVDVVRLTAAGRGVVAVRVSPAAAGTVHLVEGRAPVRIGTTTNYMSSEQLRRWIQEGRAPS